MRRVTLEFPDCTRLSEFLSKCSPLNRELTAYETLLEGFFSEQDIVNACTRYEATISTLEHA